MALPVLKLGSKGDNVKRLQKVLGVIVDGNFGYGTKTAVMAFQKANGLVADGVVGNLTWAKVIEKESGAKPTPSINLWQKMRWASSDVWYCVLPQDKYFVDFDLGVVSKFEKVSTIVNDKIAQGKTPVVAINGGYFGGSNIEQMGLSMDEGSYKNVPDIKLIDLFYRKSDGKFYIDNWTKDTPNIWAQRNDFYWAMGTTYSLVQNGVVNLENTKYHSHANGRNPRTIIGQRSNGDIVFIVVDGRRLTSKGLTASESAGLAMHLGLYQATNLDGGGSTVGIDVINGKAKVVNKPSDGVERKVGSVLIAYKK